MQEYVYNFTGMIVFQHQGLKPVVKATIAIKCKAFWHTMLVHLTAKLRILGWNPVLDNIFSLIKLFLYPRLLH